MTSFNSAIGRLLIETKIVVSSKTVSVKFQFRNRKAFDRNDEAVCQAEHHRYPVSIPQSEGF